MTWFQIVVILNPFGIYVTEEFYWNFTVKYVAKSHVKRDKIN